MFQPTRDQAIEALFTPVDVRAYTTVATAKLIANLRDEERSALGPMAAARRAEFATARACARAAMADYGIDAPVPRTAGGAPSWPTGVHGSISHTRGFCMAVASTGAHAIGIDTEEVARMKVAIERRILIESERSLLDDLDDDERCLRVATIFAAKEAFYKAHYDIDPRYLGFDVVEVAVGPAVANLAPVSFAAGSGAVAAGVLRRTTGRALVDRGRVVAGVTISTSG